MKPSALHSGSTVPTRGLGVSRRFNLATVKKGTPAFSDSARTSGQVIRSSSACSAVSSSMQTTLPHPVSYRKRNLSHAETSPDHHSLMDTKKVLWQNVSRLMVYHWGREHLARLSRDAEIALASTTRLKEQRTSVGVDLLDKIAKCFHLQAWHLLVPNLDPSNPPVVYLTEHEKALYERFRAAARDLANSPSH